MKYLVLHSFRCYGVMLRKGEVVDESAIRSPRLRLSEGKIIPAVEEPLVPDKGADSAVISSGGAEQQVVAAPAVQSPPTNGDKPKSPRLSFGS